MLSQFKSHLKLAFSEKAFKRYKFWTPEINWQCLKRNRLYSFGRFHFVVGALFNLITAFD